MTKETGRTIEQLEAILGFYTNDINDTLTELKEDELQTLLQLEAKGQKRDYIITRIFTRFNKVKGQRILKDILNGNLEGDLNGENNNTSDN